MDEGIYECGIWTGGKQDIVMKTQELDLLTVEGLDLQVIVTGTRSQILDFYLDCFAPDSFDVLLDWS